MQIIQGTTEFEINGRTAVAIGKFDGIHLGHQKLLRFILEQREQGLQAAVFTFDPPPSALFLEAPDKELMTKEEKRKAFEEMGIDVLIEFPLSVETAGILPEDFVEHILVLQMHAAYIAAGTDLSFGAGGAGNAMLLKAMARFGGYEVQIIDKVCYKGQEVSSSYVKEEIKKGHMKEASALLGKPYRVQGVVLHGNHFGRTLGMPTVNLLLQESKLLPPNGVYYSRVLMEGIWYAGMTNIGYKPTVSDVARVGVETYIYEFDQDVYGKEICVELLEYKRPEMKFNGKDELKAQMMKDIELGMTFHQNLLMKG